MNKIDIRKLYEENKRIILSIMAIVVICSLVYMTKKTYSNEIDDVFTNQTVDGLKFENGSLDYKDNTTTITTEVYNDTDNDYSLSTIDVEVTLDNNEKEILTGYVGNVIESHDGKLLSVSVDKDLSNIKKIVYNINK